MYIHINDIQNICYVYNIHLSYIHTGVYVYIYLIINLLSFQNYIVNCVKLELLSCGIYIILSFCENRTNIILCAQRSNLITINLITI